MAWPTQVYRRDAGYDVLETTNAAPEGAGLERSEDLRSGTDLIEAYLRALDYGDDIAAGIATAMMHEAAGDVRLALARATALPGPETEWRSLPDATGTPLRLLHQDITLISLRRLVRRVRSIPSASANDD